jgi:hypothetical protein
MTPFPGKSATLSVGGTSKPLDEVSLSIEGEEIDFTNFLSSGWRELTQGIRFVDLEAAGPYNGIAVGASGGDALASPNVTFIFAFGGAGPTITIPALLVKTPVKTAVRDIGRISYTAKSTGAVTLSY